VSEGATVTDQSNGIQILGGGLTGLSAGFVLSRAGADVSLLESDSTVGGLSRTIHHNGFRFDLGGHRFFTTNKRIEKFVNDLMGNELVSVPRKSKIYLRGKYFDYPLKPLNAMSGFGIPTTLKIIADYGTERIRALLKKQTPASLEDWVVANFGRTLFNMYFKVYSEKVWGIDCDRISAGWVDQRISGLSLAKAVKNAVFKLKGKQLPTLVDRFLYPELGIGRISDRLREEIEVSGGRVFTHARIERINHSGARIDSIVVNQNGRSRMMPGKEFVSSIAVTKLVRMLSPAPPRDVLAAVSKLRFRDLVVVAVMVGRRRVTDLTWLYVPEQHIPFGRIHEPTNWSEKMAPEGKTLLVTEYFSFQGDRIWNMSDQGLADLTIDHMERLGFVRRDEVVDSAVVRVPRAYPLFETGHEGPCDEIYTYLRRFENLHIAGRAGMFRYYNMDHAIASGIHSAETIMRKIAGPRGSRETDLVPAGDETCAAR
jgi:protoporphyrinogen oxidase